MRTAAKTLHFPLSGVSRNLSFRESTTPDGVKDYGTPDAMNVRGCCTFGDRARGGSRPGLAKINGVVDTPSAVPFMWPNGEEVLWPDGSSVLASVESRTVTPDGREIVDPHGPVKVEAVKGNAPETDDGSVTARYRARTFVSSCSMWFCSRTGDETDWDYGGDSEDAGRAVAGNVALAGCAGEPITAIIPVADKFLYIATARSLWCVHGEPTSGQTVLVSDGVGCCGRNAWCFDGRHLWILSYQGIFTLAPGEHPVYFSHRVPLLSGLDEDAILVADHETNGVYAFMSGACWYVEKDTKSLWPMSFGQTVAPVSAAHVVVGGVNKTAFMCADGEWRVFDPGSSTDDGIGFASSVAIGPFRLSDGDDKDGMLSEVYATTGTGSDDVSVRFYTAHSPEDAVRSAEDGGGVEFVVTDGWNQVIRPRVRGAWCVMVLSSSGRWAYESIHVQNKALGRLR